MCCLNVGKYRGAIDWGWVATLFGLSMGLAIPCQGPKASTLNPRLQTKTQKHKYVRKEAHIHWCILGAALYCIWFSIPLHSNSIECVICTLIVVHCKRTLPRKVCLFYGDALFWALRWCDWLPKICICICTWLCMCTCMCICIGVFYVLWWFYGDALF